MCGNYVGSIRIEAIPAFLMTRTLVSFLYNELNTLRNVQYFTRRIFIRRQFKIKIKAILDSCLKITILYCIGPQAKQLFDEAQKFLKELCERRLLRASGVLAFYPAQAEGDDVVLYEVDSPADLHVSLEPGRPFPVLPRAQSDVRPGRRLAVLHGLRQQAEKDSLLDPYSCLSDFVAPASSNKMDYVGIFAVTAGLGINELVSKYVSLIPIQYL